MKAFEKWWRNIRSNHSLFKYKYEQGWKAALEWVKSDLHPGERVTRILEEIEKELED